MRKYEWAPIPVHMVLRSLTRVLSATVVLVLSWALLPIAAHAGELGNGLSQGDSSQANSYETPIHVYDGSVHSAQLYTSEAALLASEDAKTSTQGTVLPATGAFFVFVRVFVAANSEAAFTRFTVNGAGETTLNLRVGSGAIEVSEHAALRMAQRGVSINSAEAALAQNPFQYFHGGVWKTGYYDTTSRVFIGTVNGEVTTVISNASTNYISNLQAVLP